LNLRPPEPHSGALPGCATARASIPACHIEYSGSVGHLSMARRPRGRAFSPDDVL